MNLSRKIVIIRLVISLAVFAYLDYLFYNKFSIHDKNYEFMVLTVFLALYLLWAALSQLKFHHIAVFPTILERDERTHFMLTLVYFLTIFMAFIDFASLDVSRIHSIEPVSFYVGIGLFLVACIIRYWAYASIGNYFSPQIKLYQDHKLVTSGAYRRLRHPLYLGMLMELVAVASMFSSGGAFLLIVILAIPAVLFRIKLEEAVMNEGFPEEYAAYSRRSKKLIPFIF